MRSIRKVMAVLYDIKDGKPYYLVLHRILRWNGWELLKGTVEEGEVLKETVKREVEEETGLKKFNVLGRLGYKFDWIWGDTRVVVEEVFMVRADMKNRINLKQKIREHDAYAWLSKEEAMQRLTYENSIKALELADRKLFK